MLSCRRHFVEPVEHLRMHSSMQANVLLKSKFFEYKTTVTPNIVNIFIDHFLPFDQWRIKTFLDRRHSEISLTL